MKRVILYTFCLANLYACNGQDTKIKNESIPIDLESKVNNLVKQYTDLDIFSGVVLIAEKGKPVYQKAFGLADREKNNPNTINTYFDIGSINKAFTKALIIQLIGEGKIKPEDNLGKYLKGFPSEPSEKVTIKNLIDHTSGYGDYMQEPGFFDKPKDQQTMKAILEIIKEMPLNFDPGSEFQYSNSGYLLLGGIIESVTGKSYYQNVKDKIIQPLGMKNSIVDDTKESYPNRAIGYMKTMREELENNNGILMTPTPAGGFIMTAEDLLKFMEAYFFSDKLVSKEGLKHDDFYRFVEKVKKDGGAIPIAGGFQGSNAVAYNDLQNHRIIIVLANMDEPVAEKLAGGIYKIINGKEPEGPSLPVLQNVYMAFSENGINYVKDNFEELTKNFDDQREPKDMLLNNMGYNLLFSGETDKAIQIFKLNTELFPKIGNVWDSYGEALLKSGDKKGALMAYKKALEINPNIPSAAKMVKELEQTKN